MEEVIAFPAATKQRRAPREAKRIRHSHPDGPKAFDLCNEMEADLSQIRRCASTLFLLAEGMTAGQEQDAVFLLANTLDDAVKTAEEKRGKISHATWAYKYATASL